MNTTPKALFVTAEASPFIKVGGLGDVAGSLPHALRAGGADVRMALPLHHQIDRRRFDLRPLMEFAIPSVHGDVPALVYETRVADLPVYLIASPLLPETGPLYSTQSALDGPKFVHFSLACLELVRRLDWRINILHAQDWHTAPAIYALALRRPEEPFFASTAGLLTVHNLPYHGEGAAQALADFGLPPAVDSPLPWWAQNRPLPLGLYAADHINTVSPGYAAEMLTDEFGAGLAGFLRTHKAGVLSGILNGLDQAAWDPQTDADLPVRYSRADLAPKKVNKRALQAELGLPETAATPLFAIVSRMDEQKGIDLALDGLARTLDLPWQVVILGSGNPEIEEAARRMAAELPERVRTVIDFNAPLGRRIYAGADAFLIPSRYEPCGLTQMIAMRYGTVPIARAVGGLKDTIRDHAAGEDSTGFLFAEASAAGMETALRRAIAVYGDQRRWRGLQLRGMRQDFSWESSARAYLALYRSLAARRIG